MDPFDPPSSWQPVTETELDVYLAYLGTVNRTYHAMVRENGFLYQLDGGPPFAFVSDDIKIWMRPRPPGDLCHET